MSERVFHEIYIHIVWHTKHSVPLLTPAVEARVHEFLRHRCHKTKGVYFHTIGGTENHVHLALNIEPFVRISDLIGDLKGSSSHLMKEHAGADSLYWQRGYGVVGFGKKQLPFVLDYIARQKEHHAQGRIHPRLERTEVEEATPPGTTS